MRIFSPGLDALDYTFNYKRDETLALQAKDHQTVTIDDLRRIALWKINRVLEIPDDTLSELHVVALTNPLTVDSPIALKALRALTACSGVGFPMASAFLKFIRPDVFPIIDVRAYRALMGRKIRPEQYSVDIYLEYARSLAEIAALHGIALRDVDEQLYCFDKEHNGAIAA